MGYFYFLGFKNWNHLHTELSLGYFFFYSHKQYCFIYAVFDCLVVGIMHFLGQMDPSLKSSNMLFIRLLLANTWKKDRGSPCSFERKEVFISLSGLV